MQILKTEKWHKTPRKMGALIVIFALICLYLLRNSKGLCSIYWMLMYEPSDFPGTRKLLEFLRDMRTGCPPLLTFAELVIYNLTGSLDLISVVAYRLSIILAYVIAMSLFSASIPRAFLSCLVSVVFVWATALIHPGNPQTYDVFFPCLILLYILFLKLAVADNCRSRDRILFATLSGFFLSMTELSRPFVLALLPLMAGLAFFSFRPFERKYYLYFLLPVIVFSGGWHLKLILLNDGQIIWSNNTGYNLANAWGRLRENSNGTYTIRGAGQIRIDVPFLHKEDKTPLADGRWPNINTEVRFNNSRLLRKAIGRYMFEEPWRFLGYCLVKMKVTLTPRTRIHAIPVKHWIIGVYKFLVKGCLLLVGVSFLGIFRRLAVEKRLRIIGEPTTALVVFIVMCLPFFVMGEFGEEARFIISVLPLLAAVPTFAFARQDAGRSVATLAEE